MIIQLLLPFKTKMMGKKRKENHNFNSNGREKHSQEMYGNMLDD